MAVSSKIKFSLGSFDFIKGFAMLLIVVCHSTNHYDTNQHNIFSFFVKILQFPSLGLVPLFFIISGYGFKPKSSAKMFKRSFSELVVPHLWVTLAVAVFYPILNYPLYGSWSDSFYGMSGFVSSMLLGSVGGVLFYNPDLFWCSVTWYLLATFVAFNCLNLVLKLKKTLYQFICVIFCIVLGSVLFEVDFIYFCIPQGLIASGYCYLGYLLKKKNIFSRIYSSIWSYIILIPLAYAELTWGYFDLCPGNFNNLLLDYIGAGCTGLLFMLIGFRLGQINCSCFDSIKYIGIYTYWIICIHSFEVIAMPWWLLTDWISSPRVKIVFTFLFRSLFIAVICFILKEFSKYRYRRRIQNEK